MEEQFAKFYENIKLTPAQRQDAIDKYTGVCKKLHDHYYSTLAYNGDTKLLIGSYGKRTHIRPARDIDVLFIMPPDKFDQYHDNTSNGPSQLLQKIKTILEEKYTSTPIKAFGKVVVLEFTETKHNVELVPAWENDDGTFIIPNSENGGSWERVDYRKELRDIYDSDIKTGKTKFLIRVIKKWSENCSADLKSFQIEQMVLSFFSTGDFSEYTTSNLVRDFFKYFHQNTSDQNLKSHLNTAFNRAEKACDFDRNNKSEQAAEEWKKILGDDFPKTVKIASQDVPMSEDELAKLNRLTAEYPSDDEEHLTHNHGIPFEINSAHSISLDADVEQNGFRKSTLMSFIQSRFPLLKSKKLLFRVNHNVPSPYQIKWKIRNFGDEAKRANALRGQIHDDTGSETRNESTLYYGEHYVECYIIKNNKCVALGRILVPIGKDY